MVRGSDPTIGYIALQINFTMPSPTDANPQEILLWVKDPEFNITTLLQSSTPAASVATFPSSSPSSPSSSTTIPIGAVVGAAVGALVFIALLVIAFVLFRRRREQAKSRMPHPITLPEPLNLTDSLPHEGEDPIPVPRVGPDSAQPAPVGTVESNDRLTTPWIRENVFRKPGRVVDLLASTTSRTGSQHSSSSNALPSEIPPNAGPVSIHSSSFLSRMPDDPPPTYNTEESVRQERTVPRSFSPELALLASANRDVINESLEARLQAAGYLPTDDPSDLTPEQWLDEYGVTRLELRRLQGLYSR